MLVAQSKYERGFIVDRNGRTAFLVIVATLPILQVAPLLIPKETKAIDDQQLAAILLRVRKVNVKRCNR